MAQLNKDRAIYALLLVIALDSMGYGFIFPVLTPMFLHGHNPLLPAGIAMPLQYFIYGLIVALYPLCMFFGAPVLGDLSDRLGRKKVLIICLVGTAIGYLVSGIGLSVSLLSLLIIGRVIDGFTAGTLPMAQAAIADVCTDEKRQAKFMGLMMFAIAGGQVLGPFLAGVFSDKHLSSLFSEAMPFYVGLVVTLFNLLWLVIAFHETYEVAYQKGFAVLKSLISFKEAFTTRSLLLMTTVFFMMQLSWSLFSQASPAYLAKLYHYSHFALGIFSASLGVFIVIGGTYVLPQLLKAVSVRAGAVIALVLMGFSCLVAGLWQNQVVFWVATFFNTVGAALTFSCVITVFSGLVDETKQGWVMGLTGAVIAAAWTITALLTGLLMQHIGAAPLIISALLAIVGSGFMLRMQRQSS